MVKYQKLNPNNARIFIDYTGKKKPVKFEYIKTKGTFSIVFKSISYLWLKFNFIIIFFNLFIFIGLLLLQQPLESIGFSKVDIIETLPNLFLLIYVVGIPLFISLIIILNKKLLSLMPYINCLTHKSFYEVEFNFEDVQNNQIELPLFKNMSLDYEATGECSKYLTNFKIIEHPFKIIHRKKKRRNEYLWKAIWQFSQQPKNGKIKVRFR